MKLTPEQIEAVWYTTPSKGYAEFARAIESLVSQEYEKRIAEIEADDWDKYKRIAALEDSLHLVAADILRNDDGAITDTLWHTGTEQLLISSAIRWSVM